jgi:hypothetical protein
LVKNLVVRKPYNPGSCYLHSTLVDLGGQNGVTATKERPDLHRASDLFLLCALVVGLLTVLAGSLGMLLGTGRMFLALSVVALAVMIGCHAVRFGGIFVVFGCFRMLFFCHRSSPLKIEVNQG